MKRSSVPLNTRQLLRLSWTIEAGLHSGRDWQTSVRWLSDREADLRLRAYAKQLIHRLKCDATDKILTQERDRSRGFAWRVLMEILLQSTKGSRHLSQLLRSYATTVNAVDKMIQREKSLLFIPRFQSWTALVIAVSLTFGLPALNPGMFESFLSLRRPDLFCAGLFPLILGFLLLQWMSFRPRRLLRPLMRMNFFFFFMSMFVESGLDLATSWRRALEAVEFDSKMRSHLSRAELTMEGLEQFLNELELKLPDPWPTMLSGLLWAKEVGVGLAQYLKSISERESDRLLFQCEDEIRKLTMTTLIPMAGLIFPATLYLVVGPQFLELLQL